MSVIATNHDILGKIKVTIPEIFITFNDRSAWRSKITDLTEDVNEIAGKVTELEKITFDVETGLLTATYQEE